MLNTYDAIEDMIKANDETVTSTEISTTVLIRRSFSTGLMCYFNTLEEGFEFGHALLREHTSDLHTERSDSNTYIEWYDTHGALWLADYIYGDMFSTIKMNGGGCIGKSKGFHVEIFVGHGIPANIRVDTIHIVPPGLAITLGEYGRVSNTTLDTSSDPRIKIYMLGWSRSWKMELALGK